MERRDFLKFLGLTTAGMGSSCLETYHWMASGSRKTNSEVKYPGEHVIPGEAQFYPSTCTECPANCGILIKVRDGNAIKLEGNPGHPVNKGGLCLRGQASLTRVYHEKRQRVPMMRNAVGKIEETTWDAAYARIHKALEAEPKCKHFYVAGHTTGSLSRLIDLFCEKIEVTRIMDFEPYCHAALREGYRKVFGKSTIPLYQIDRTDLLLTIGADILETFVSPVCYAEQFSRAIQGSRWEWFHVEPHLSVTGIKAHRRLSIKPQSEVYLLRFLLHHLPDAMRSKIPTEVLSLTGISDSQAATQTGISLSDLNHLSQRLGQASHPLVISGGVSLSHSTGLEASVLSSLLQYGLGMADQIDFASAENYDSVATFNDLELLGKESERGKIGVVFLSRTNPLGNLPAHPFRECFASAFLRVGLGDFSNQTLDECDVLLPLSHPIESMGFTTPRRNLVSIITPAIDTRYNTRQEGEILLQLMGKKTGQADFLAFVKKYLAQACMEREKHVPDTLDTIFASSGFYQKKADTLQTELCRQEVVSFFQKEAQVSPRAPAETVLIITPSLRTWDGRGNALPLVSEIPDPLTTISHGQWVTVPEKTGQTMGIKDKDEVEISSGNLHMKLPVKLQPLLPEGIVTLQHVDQVLSQTSIDKRCGQRIEYVEKVAISKTGSSVNLPILSGSTSQDGRGIIPYPIAHHTHEGAKSFYPEPRHGKYRWAMAIDLSLCIACSSCVAACYIENNVPIVGAKEHIRGRELSWLRLEPYVREDNSGIEIVPMLCQQCDMAPCEPVCPVYAANHNEEGLNVQVYNRCVGTRYCVNNCPYKVRRFHWFDNTRALPMGDVSNPDVAIRMRGVMDKCTFCIQRIRDGKDRAKDENRQVRDGEIVPACAQSCPTRAITFGNILDKHSRIYQLAHSHRAYRIYESLGVEPSVYYLRQGEKK